jgi:hypothetical protein
VESTKAHADFFSSVLFSSGVGAVIAYRIHGRIADLIFIDG